MKLKVKVRYMVWGEGKGAVYVLGTQSRDAVLVGSEKSGKILDLKFESWLYSIKHASIGARCMMPRARARGHELDLPYNRDRYNIIDLD